jgi:hypothetical protein
MVVVERLLDRNEDACVGAGDEGLGRIAPYFGMVVTYLLLDFSQAHIWLLGAFVPTTRVSLGSSSKKHFWTAPSMKKCSAWAGTASAAASKTVGFHIVIDCSAQNWSFAEFVACSLNARES